MLQRTIQSVLDFTEDRTLYLTEEASNTSREAITNVLKGWAPRRNSHSVFLLLRPWFLCKWNIYKQQFYHLLDKCIFFTYSMNIVKHCALYSVMKKAISLKWKIFQDKHSQAERDKWSLTLSYAILQFYPEIKYK